MADASVSYSLGIDQGTTGSTALLLRVRDLQADVLGRATVEFPQHYPQPGWVEHDLNEVWQSVATACQQALQQAASADGKFVAGKIRAVGITNQRETLCAFERTSSAPMHRAIVWQCRRTQGICQDLRKSGVEESLRARTGLVLDPYFSGSKATWLLRESPSVRNGVRSGRCVLGTMDTYLIHRLSGGLAFVTEASNASRTMLFDTQSGAWSPDLLDVFSVPSLDCLPEVRDSAGEFARTKGVGFLPDGLPITGVLGDQQAALAGQACFSPSLAKCTYGTGAFLLVHAGETWPRSVPGILTTAAWRLGGRMTFALEGSAFIAGAAVQFLRDQLGIVSAASETEMMARQCTGAPEIYFVPSLSGMGAPYWNADCRGTLFGLTRGTSRAQIVRAALEGIAFQVMDLVSAMNQGLPRAISEMRVDGGAAANNLLMEMQADFSELTVNRPKILETTAMGCIMFAALGVGACRNLEELASWRVADHVFKRRTGQDAGQARARQVAGWQRAVQATIAFATAN